VGRFGRVVEAVTRNFDGEIFCTDHRLARQARLRFQAPGLVEVVLFQLVGLPEGVAQSVYRFPEVPRAKALTRGAKVAKELGLVAGEDATAAELRGIAAVRFVELDEDEEKAKGTSNAPNLIWGDAVLPTSTFTIFANGGEQPLPLIIGNTSDDSSVLKEFGLGPLTLAAAVPAEYKPLTTYYPDLTWNQGTELGRRTGRDSIFTVQTYKIAQGRRERATTWRYYFDYNATCLATDAPNGPRHGDDIVFTLKTGDLAPPTKDHFTAEDRVVEDLVSTYWFELPAPARRHARGARCGPPHGGER
jgi:para-nitrobenzyl esterase